MLLLSFSFLRLRGFFLVAEGVPDPPHCGSLGAYHVLLGPQGPEHGTGGQNEVDCPAVGEGDFVDSVWADGSNGCDALDCDIWQDDGAKHAPDGLVGGRLAHGEVEMAGVAAKSTGRGCWVAVCRCPTQVGLVPSGAQEEYPSCLPVLRPRRRAEGALRQGKGQMWHARRAVGKLKGCHGGGGDGVECGYGGRDNSETMNRPGVHQPLPICKHFERLRAVLPSGQRRKISWIGRPKPTRTNQRSSHKRDKGWRGCW